MWRDFRFLGTHIKDDLTWTINSSTIQKKAQQRLYFLRILRKNNLTDRLLVSFYRSSIESVLSYGVTLWFSSCTAAERKVLQREHLPNTAQRICRCPLPSLEDIYRLKRAHSILKGSSHPDHHLFELLPSGRCFRTIYSKTNRLKNSFYPRAISEINKRQN